MFSIIIPTFNNLNYLKLCVDSIKKNSTLDHEIIIHVNEGHDGTFQYVKQNNLSYTYSKKNVGLCTGTNLAASKSSTDYVLYTHDDMYFCPNWDNVLAAALPIPEPVPVIRIVLSFRQSLEGLKSSMINDFL